MIFWYNRLGANRKKGGAPRMDRRVERTKRNIYLAFFELMKKKAMDDITITELAAAADIDRRTFYKHYSTVIDVYEEFMGQLEEALYGYLCDCDTDAGFDFPKFFSQLERMLGSQRAFFEKLSTDKASMFLRYDCKDALERALRRYYAGHYPGSAEEFSVYVRSVAYMITGLGSDFLTDKHSLSFEEFFRHAIPLLEKIWVPRTN